MMTRWNQMLNTCRLGIWCPQSHRYFPFYQRQMHPAVDSLEACVFMLNYIGVHPLEA